MSSQPSAHTVGEPFLYVTELLHRINNEYMRAISLATTLAARSSNDETKVALFQVIDQIRALARAHEILRPPLTNTFTDLSLTMTQLCDAMTSSGLAQRGVELHLAIEKPVFITNASRHAFVGQTGRISVVVKTLSGQVICRVGDNGSPAATLKRGLGTELIGALAADLEGYVERLHRPSGTVVTLCFPQDPAE